MASRVNTKFVVVLIVVLLAVSGPAGATEAGDAPTVGGPSPRQVDINKASAAELTAIPGVGDTLAQRIVEFREKQGPFRRVEDLLKIKGIGEKSFQKMRPHVKVSETD